MTKGVSRVYLDGSKEDYLVLCRECPYTSGPYSDTESAHISRRRHNRWHVDDYNREWHRKRAANCS